MSDEIYPFYVLHENGYRPAGGAFPSIEASLNAIKSHFRDNADDKSITMETRQRRDLDYRIYRCVDEKRVDFIVEIGPDPSQQMTAYATHKIIESRFANAPKSGGV